MVISKLKAFFAPETTTEQKTVVAPTTDSKFASLETALGYSFKNQTLLVHALTHKSSVKPEQDPNGLTSNERLEFLGDSVINCLVTAELFHKYPDYSEGRLAKMKSLLVSRKILGIVANRIDLSRYILRGRSEKKNKREGGNSIESNAIESVLGAIYLDSGFDAVESVLKKILYPSIEFFLNDVENRNYKSRILEMSQKDGHGIPRYPMISEEGPDHDKRFTIAIEIAGVRLGTGTGKNKKEAEQDAARIAVQKYPETQFEKVLE